MTPTQTRSAPLTLRPYQLLCALCDASSSRDLRARIAAFPDRPITLRCNAEDVYSYQDPGLADDTPPSPEFNRKRDLDILCALDLAPGSTLPARTLLHVVLRRIPTVAGICGYPAETSPAWSGCPRAASGDYERAHALGIQALIAPRDAAEMERDKAASVAAMESGACLTIRPHVMMCAVCNFGQTDGHPTPLAADNIVEFIAIIRRKPDTPVKLVPGADWMICAPCPLRVPGMNACVNILGSGGLSNEKRDLDLLQAIGLQYGDTMPGRELYRLILARVPSTEPICRRDNADPSVWWDGCGEGNRTCGSAGYARGRELLLEEWG